jgi:hypothetical protein
MFGLETIAALLTPVPTLADLERQYVGSAYEVRTTLFGYQPGRITSVFRDAMTGRYMAQWVEASGRCNDILTIEQLMEAE